MNVDFLKKFATVYDSVCKPLCNRYGITKTGFDILMFLGNNPEYNMASQIVEIRKIKANLVSVNVDKLVKEGYLERCSVENDRRKTQLNLCDKAMPLVKEGQQLQNQFLDSLMNETSKEERETFMKVLQTMSGNLDRMMEDL